jgi:hypothetical protein
MGTKVIVIRGEDTRVSDFQASGIQELHVFHYATHSVEWSVMYGKAVDATFADHFTRDGEPIHVWMSFHMMRVDTEEAIYLAHKESAFLWDECRMVVHD